MSPPPRTIALTGFTYDVSGNLTLTVHGGEDIRIERADLAVLRAALEERRKRRRK